jgi:hypothetical protein
MNDVSDIKISNLKADNPNSTVPIIEVIKGNDIIISESYSWKPHPVFISVCESSNNIKLINNDFSNIEKVTKDNQKQVLLISNLNQ